MKPKYILTIAATLLCAAALDTLAQGRHVASLNLAPAAKDALITALAGEAGEYAARAEYAAILAKFGSDIQPYANIYRAEERHIAALVRQCQKYGVAVPADTYMGKITAPETLLEAAQAGIDAEKLNVAMYDKLLPAVEGYADLVQVFKNLQAASAQRHLPAFEAAAAADGTTSAALCGRTGFRAQQGRAGCPRPLGVCQMRGRGNNCPFAGGGSGPASGRGGGW